jgi:hypothetical protein
MINIPLRFSFQVVRSYHIPLPYVASEVNVASMVLLPRSDYATAEIAYDSSNKMQF